MVRKRATNLKANRPNLAKQGIKVITSKYFILKRWHNHNFRTKYQLERAKTKRFI